MNYRNKKCIENFIILKYSEDLMLRNVMLQGALRASLEPLCYFLDNYWSRVEYP
jgi:hypothetical protein